MPAEGQPGREGQPGPTHPTVGSTLPAVYARDPLLQAFAAGLDTLTQPVFEELDALEGRLALRSPSPPSFLRWLALAVGAATETVWDDIRVREAISRAAGLAARRGTWQGLRDEAKHLYGWNAEINDPGTVTKTVQGLAQRPSIAITLSPGTSRSVDPEQARRLMARHVPAHVHYTLTLNSRQGAPGEKSLHRRVPDPGLPVPMLQGSAAERRATLEAAAREAVRRAQTKWLATDDPGSTLLTACTAVAARMRDALPLVAERHRLTALERLGVRPRPAAAAHTNVTFRLAAAPLQPIVVPAGTQVATAASGTAPAVAFTTTESALIAPCTLLAWGIARPSLTCSEGTISGELHPQGQATPLHPDECLLVLARTMLPGALVQLGIVSDETTRPQKPGVWEAWQGAGWTPCADSHTPDSTTDLTRSGNLVLRLPTTGAPARVRLVDLGGGPGWDEENVWLLRYRPGDLDIPRDLRISALTLSAPIEATVPVLHGELIDGEVLGVSDGLPGQRFRFAHQPLPDSWPILVEVTADGLTKHWDVVDSFANSSPRSRHVVIDGANSELVFGPLVDGPAGPRHYGMVPPIGARIRVRRYATGGGKAGNVPARALNVLRKPIPQVSAVSNQKAATGGADAQRPADAFARAPLALPGRERAVTMGDYERMALAAGVGVAQAHCIPDNGLAQLDPIMAETAQLRPAHTRIAFTRTLPDPLTEMPPAVDLPKGTKVVGQTSHWLGETVLETRAGLRLGPERLATASVAPVVIPPSSSLPWVNDGERWDRFLVSPPWNVDVRQGAPGSLVLKIAFEPVVRQSIAEALRLIQQEAIWYENNIKDMEEKVTKFQEERQTLARQLKDDRNIQDAQKIVQFTVEILAAKIKAAKFDNDADFLMWKIRFLDMKNSDGSQDEAIKQLKGEWDTAHNKAEEQRTKVRELERKITLIERGQAERKTEISWLLHAIRNLDDQIRSLNLQIANLKAVLIRLEARSRTLEGDPFETHWDLWAMDSWEPVTASSTHFGENWVLETLPIDESFTVGTPPPEVTQLLPPGGSLPSLLPRYWLRCTIAKRAEVQFALSAVEALRVHGTVDADQIDHSAEYAVEVEEDEEGRLTADLGTGICGPLPDFHVEGMGQLRVVRNLLTSGEFDPDVVLDRERGILHFGVELTEADGTKVRCGFIPHRRDAILVKGLVATRGAEVNDETISEAGVDVDDIEAKVLDPLTGGITVEAPLRSPNYPEVALLVVPDGIEEPDGHIPHERLTPTPALVQRLRDRLIRVQPVGVALDVSSPGYQWIRVEAELVADRHLQAAAREELRKSALEALNRFFSPVTGPDGTGWPLGRPVLRGDAFFHLGTVPGVAEVEQVRLYAIDPVTQQKGTAVDRIDMPPYAVVLSCGHEVTVIASIDQEYL